MNTSRPKSLLAIMVTLQCITVAAIYGLGPSAPAVAQTAARTAAQTTAQGIPDAGAQQQAIIDQLKDVNAKLDRVVSILSGGIELKPPKSNDAPQGH